MTLYIVFLFSYIYYTNYEVNVQQNFSLNHHSTKDTSISLMLLLLTYSSCRLSLLFEFATTLTQRIMIELVTKVFGFGAPPLIPSIVIVQYYNMYIQMTFNKLDGMNYSTWS